MRARRRESYLITVYMYMYSTYIRSTYIQCFRQWRQAALTTFFASLLCTYGTTELNMLFSAVTLFSVSPSARRSIQGLSKSKE